MTMTGKHVLAAVVVVCVVLLAFGGAFVMRQPDRPAANGRIGGAAPPVPEQGSQRPNVVLIVLDAFRTDRLGAVRGGVPVTPALTRLAETSYRFTNAVTPCTWTKPAMASAFTSRYVDAHQVYYSMDPARPEAPTGHALPGVLETMATYFREAGYSTAGIQTNGNLVERLGFAEGFDRYLFQNDADADWVTGLALEQLDDLRAPFFLYVHYMDPHALYSPPEPYRTLFGPLPELTAAEEATVGRSIDYLLDQVEHRLGARAGRKFSPLSPEGRDTLRILYDAECRFMDDKLAKLFEHLDSTTPNTLMVVLADHGEEFWEHGSMGHGQTMYQEQLAVPLFFHGPGLEPRADARPVETLHILPTMAAFAGLGPRPQWQGYDLLSGEDQGLQPLVRGSQGVATPCPETRPVFSNTYASYPRMNVHTEMVLNGDLKLIRNHVSDAIELYDLAEDPLETTNIAPQRPDAAAHMRLLLDEHRATNVRHTGGRVKPESVQLPPDLVEQLKALGYFPADEDGDAQPAAPAGG